MAFGWGAGQRLGETAAAMHSSARRAALDSWREPSEDRSAKVGGGRLLAHELDGVCTALGGKAAQQGLQHVVAEGGLEQLAQRLPACGAALGLVSAWRRRGAGNV